MIHISAIQNDIHGVIILNDMGSENITFTKMSLSFLSLSMRILGHIEGDKQRQRSQYDVDRHTRYLHILRDGEFSAQT